MREGALNNRYSFFAAASLALALVIASGCLPKPPSEQGGINITLYGFSIMKEPLEKSIYSAFSDKWKKEHGQEVRFTSSFAGSETVTNQILQGVSAEVVILSIERDAQRLKDGKFVTSDWHTLPQKGIVNKTPFVILVRKGNPKGIKDFPDLGKSGVKIIHPDPVSSGGAQWSILAIYGSALVKSEKQTGEKDEARALETLRTIWRNVISTPASAREARTQFETSSADALITYELDALQMKQSAKPVEIVVPEATIFGEHPAVVVDRNVTAAKRPIIDAFMQFLWSDEAQRAFVQSGFRSATNEALDSENSNFAHINMPFTIDYFGGWDRAYPEIIERIFKQKVQQGK